MGEREKIIETLRASGYGYFVTHEKANADKALNDAADALIAAGIGDVKETEHRAEVAERALLNACVNLIKDKEDNVNMELLARVVYTKYLRKAERC